MVLAAVGAVVTGNWLERAPLLFLFSLRNTLQDYAIGRSRRVIRSLMKLRPDKGLVRNEDGSKTYRAVEDLGIGELIHPQTERTHSHRRPGAVGTDVALETADVVLMTDDLEKLPFVINLERTLAMREVR